MKNINKIIIGLISPKYLNAIKEADKNNLLKTDEINTIQNEKFSQLIKFTSKHNPYYNKILAHKNIENINDIAKIPFLTKDITKRHFLEIKSENLPLKRFKNNSTSGSTGESMHFYSDRSADYIRHACTIRGDGWTGWKFGEPKVIIWGSVKDNKKTKSLKNKLKNSRFLFNTTMLSSFDMTDEDMLEYIRIIDKKKPSLIVGYPSSLELFSKYIISNYYNIHTPKGIITGGESLYEPQRKIIQKAFHCKVLDRYGCREVGHIANECKEQKGLHISSDHVIVEVINEKGEVCKPGELGEIVVTDLDNYVFPFIRYKIGDLGVLYNRKCKCGRNFHLLEKVEGRTFDLVIGTNGNRVLGTFWSINFRYNVKGIDQFQVIQKKLGIIKINVKVNEEWNNEEKNNLIDIIRNKLGNDMKINIEEVDNFTLDKSGKFRWVISEVSPFVKK